MNLPNFICPGAAKAGTTSLYAILSQHPDIFLSGVNKESHFFDYDDNYARGLAWYSDTFFGGHEGQAAIGDITPSYMFLPKAVERIHRDLPGSTRFIFMLRDPAYRAFSHYRFNVKRSYESRDFEEALAEEDAYTARDFFSLIHYSYTARGLYSGQVRRLMDLYPREQMMFILFEEDFLARKPATIRSVENFLGIGHATLDLDAHANAASEARSSALNRILFRSKVARTVGKALIPSYESRRSVFRKIKKMNERPGTSSDLKPGQAEAMYNRFFRDDIDRLEELIGRDLAAWKH